MSLPIVQTAPSPLIATQAARPAPTRLGCLRCQILGHRNLLCRDADACAKLPHSFALGPVLILGWLAMAVAFVVAVTR